MFRIISLFLLSSINLFGFLDPSKIDHKEIVTEIKDVVKFVSIENKKETFVLFAESQPYIIKSYNDFATVKIASFLKVNKGNKKKVVLHFNYFHLGNGIKYQYSFRVCNAFSDEIKSE